MRRAAAALLMAALALWACASALMGALRAYLDRAPSEAIGLCLAALCAMGVATGTVVLVLAERESRR